jgi:hypothetical protein
MELKPKSEYWEFRKKNFYIYTIGFGAVCVASGWGLHVEYLKYTSLLYFLPSVIAAIMILMKFWKSAYQERK